MFKKKLNNEDVNFWLSYADLMAGLLFVFILVIGAIVVKSIVLKNSLDSKNSSLDSTKSRLSLRDSEIKKLKYLLAKKSEELEDTKDDLTLKDKNLEILMQEVEDKKAKIKGLTGIKLQVITQLRTTLGDKVAIDMKSGSLRLSSNILFDKSSALLKEQSKEELKKVFINYIGSLIFNPKIKNQLDRIIIEGHTDSDGSYLHNLELSQQRAYAVMNYLLSLEFTKINNLQSLLVASGRSYLDTIKDSNNREDKLKSRRIEIKFRLKNDDAMEQIEKILED